MSAILKISAKQLKQAAKIKEKIESLEKELAKLSDPGSGFLLHS